MALEDLTGPSKFIGDLVKENPDGTTDFVASVDDHIRGLKNVLLNTFPSATEALTVTPTELNALTDAAVFILDFLAAGNKNAALQALGFGDLEGNQGKVPFVNDDQNGFIYDTPGSQGAWAWGVVDSDGTMLSQLNPGDSSVRVSEGRYQVTLATAATVDPYVIMVTPQTPVVGSIRAASTTIMSPTVFDVGVRAASGSVTDGAFGFVVYN